MLFDSLNRMENYKKNITNTYQRALLNNAKGFGFKIYPADLNLLKIELKKLGFNSIFFRHGYIRIYF